MAKSHPRLLVTSVFIIQFLDKTAECGVKFLTFNAILVDQQRRRWSIHRLAKTAENVRPPDTNSPPTRGRGGFHETIVRPHLQSIILHFFCHCMNEIPCDWRDRRSEGGHRSRRDSPPTPPSGDVECLSDFYKKRFGSHSPGIILQIFSIIPFFFRFRRLPKPSYVSVRPIAEWWGHKVNFGKRV